MAKNNTTTNDQLKDPGFLMELWQQIKLVFYLLRDRDVPLYLKVLPFAGLLYVLFPIDFIPDVIPVLGQLDDLTILIVGLKVFIEMAPANIVAQYMDQMRGLTRVVDGEATDVTSTKKSLTDQVIIEQKARPDLKSKNGS